MGFASVAAGLAAPMEATVTCAESPVCQTFGRNVEATFDIPFRYNVPGPGGVYLGIVGDQAHATRKSSHNCFPMQEDGGYDPNHAHAYDCRPATKEIGMRLVRATLADPHDRVRYVNYDNVRYYPDGSTDAPIDHPTFHVSMLPGTTFDTRPFFGTAPEPDPDPIPMEDDDMILRLKGYTGAQDRPPIFVGGVGHFVPGDFVDEYVKGRRSGVIELPNTDKGRAHFDKVAQLVKDNN